MTDVLSFGSCFDILISFTAFGFSISVIMFLAILAWNLVIKLFKQA